MIHLTKKLPLIILAFALSCIFFSCTDEKSVISVKSMLNEMVDRDEQSRFPKIDFRLKQQSSYNRASVSPEDSVGFSTETRTRALDGMPFSSSFQLDMEIWSWTDCEMGYGVGVMWYGDADIISNRKPLEQEVLNVPKIRTTS